jgi:hypothetical protein
MALDHNDIFIRSTSKRRAETFRIKLMFDEAHRLREEGHLRAYANKVAEITVAHSHLDPRWAKSTQEVAIKAYLFRRHYFQRHKGSPRELNCKNEELAHLDRVLASTGRLLGFFEEQLKLGFFVEALGKPVSFV